MIGFLPEIYPDELVYSFLARYYVRSGYINYTFFAENIYVNKNTVPDIEIFNTFTKESLNVITKNYSLDYLIKNHTMFNFYARFINLLKSSGLLVLARASSAEIRFCLYRFAKAVSRVCIPMPAPV